MNQRILQLIDSLEAGGAERMAVNYANALQSQIEFSGLAATRKEGALLGQLAPDVPYLFLNKKGRFDRQAILRLRKFVVANRIQVIHAHSTSFFLAVLVKLLHPKLKIVWHDHYGNSEFLEKRPARALQLASLFFAGTIAVNKKLLEWGRRKLFCSNAVYLPNFVLEQSLENSAAETQLHGTPGKRIVCLANLRPQKGHFFLLDVAQKLQADHPDWTFHLVGKDFNDDYSQKLHSQITVRGLENHVFVYGSRNDIGAILRQSDIGILTSHSEGLPVSLLEYGLFGLPVVVTRVGEIPEIMDASHGIIVEDSDLEAFSEGLHRLISDKGQAETYAKALHNLIYTTFVSGAVVEKYTGWIGKLR